MFVWHRKIYMEVEIIFTCDLYFLYLSYKVGSYMNYLLLKNMKVFKGFQINLGYKEIKWIGVGEIRTPLLYSMGSLQYRDSTIKWWNIHFISFEKISFMENWCNWCYLEMQPGKLGIIFGNTTCKASGYSVWTIF